MNTRLKMAALVALSALFVVGCNKGSKRLDVTQRLARGQSVYMGIANDTTENLNINSSGQWGNIVGNPDMDSNFFNAQVRGLMTATLPENQIGNVASIAGPTSGVRFQGAVRATFVGGVLSNVDMTTAQIRIAIWDSLAGTNDADGKLIPEYPIHMIGATGVAATNAVNMIFSDAYGTISLNGNVSGGLFQGTISFQNIANPYMSGLPQGGKLGNFTIAVCDFFVCM